MTSLRTSRDAGTHFATRAGMVSCRAAVRALLPWVAGPIAGTVSGTLAVTLAIALSSAGCQARDAPQLRSSTKARATPAPAAAAGVPQSPAAPPLDLPAEPLPGCATLRDVAVSDLVRIEGSTLLYADATEGLTVVDVVDAAHPRQVAVVPFVGTPKALFVRNGIAWLVFVDADSHVLPGKVATVVRAVDVRAPSRPHVIGELVRQGFARDAKLVGGVLYVMNASATGTSVESFGLRNEGLRALDIVRLPGKPAQLAASSAGLAAVTAGEESTTVAWLDLPLDQPGALVLREPVQVPGGVATWSRGEGSIVSADEGQRVRLVTCSTRSCGAADAATLRVVDFGTQTTARIGPSLRLTEHGGLPVTRFADELLYVAEESPASGGTSILHVVRTEDRGPRFLSHLTLHGTISALVPRDSSLVALGTKESADPASTIVIHDIDVGRPTAPRLRSTVSFGSDWTWSLALDDDNALSFDPGSHLMSLPFTAWRDADRRSVTGTQLVDLSPYGSQNAATLAAEGAVERAVFLDGRLVTIGPNGIVGIDYARARRSELLETGVELMPR